MALKWCLRCLFMISLINSCLCDYQHGPDPWDYGVSKVNQQTDLEEADFVSDFKSTSSMKGISSHRNCAAEEWFFKRILTILVKGGTVKKEEDGSTHVSIQMKFPAERWKPLEDCLHSNAGFSEEVYRRAIAYVEEAIYQPNIVEIIVFTWTEHILFYLEEYRIYIAWVFGAISIILASLYVWHHIAHRHIYLLLFLVIYLYEACISYKEAEQQEYNNFVSALNSCKWYFWTSSCHIAPPDPLVFLRHMHPLKIGMRIFTMLVSEPIIIISSTVKVMADGLTDGLWFPFDRIVNIVLIVVINLFLILSLIMVLFNFILNIPFNLSFFAGLIHIGVKQRHRTFSNPQPSVNIPPNPEQEDRITGQNLEKLLSFCAQALNSNSQSVKGVIRPSVKEKTIEKSASAGCLTDLVKISKNTKSGFKRKNFWKLKLRREIGSGDNDSNPK